MNLTLVLLDATGKAMGSAFSSSYRVVTGDPPEPEPVIESPSENHTPSQLIQTSPLPNGIVMYADGQRPAGFNGVNTFYCRHYPDIPHMIIETASGNVEVPALLVICAPITRNDLNDVDKMQRLTKMDFSDPELLKQGNSERQQLNHNLNTHKGLFNHTFTLVTHGAYCYTFQSVYGPIEIFYAPEIHTSNGFSKFDVFVVVELPREQAEPTVQRPLLGRFWSALLGADDASSSQPTAPLAPCVSVLWVDDQGNERITTFSDCQLDTKEIGLP